jgi:hypothetical protein
VEMNMNHIHLYDLFRRVLSLSDGKAADFVMAVEDLTGLKFEANKDLLASKNKIHLLEQSVEKELFL